MERLLILLVLCAVSCFAGEYGNFGAPTSAATVTTVTSRITGVRLVNKGGGATASCEILDRTTNCSGSGCPLGEYPFTADPQTISDIYSPGVLATSGFTVSCTSNKVSLDIVYQTPQ